MVIANRSAKINEAEMQDPSTEDEQIIVVHAIITGHVQGVGFRATVLHYARQFELAGIVRNLANGTVEIFVQGSRKRILDLMHALKQEFGPKHISNIDQKQITPQKYYHDFNIAY